MTMFRVPNDPETPTFDDAFKVSFWRWLTSKGAARHEWARRRNAAAQVAGANQRARVEARRDENRAALQQKIVEARQNAHWGDDLMRAREARKPPEDTP